MTTDPTFTPAPEALPVPDPAPAAPVSQALSLDAILSTDDLGTQDVPMPEWGGSVTVRGLGYAEWDDLRSAATVGGEIDEKMLTRNLIAAALTSPAVSPEQATLLMAKSVPAVARLSKAILEVSKLGEGSVEQAEAAFPA